MAVVNKLKRSKQKVNSKTLKVNWSSWQTSDEEEILKRKLRAEAEKYKIENLVPGQVFSSYQVYSNTNKKYLVEIRSIKEMINSCGCVDYNGNGLGTCKHIEYVLNYINQKHKKQIKALNYESNNLEIFYDNRWDYDNNQLNIKLKYPKNCEINKYTEINKFFTQDGALLNSNFYPQILEVLKSLPAEQNVAIRVSKHIPDKLDYIESQNCKHKAYEDFLKDVTESKYNLNPVKAKLYPYQEAGMLHLAFKERALLADEMGLGKTIQAIAACELLKTYKNIKRTLIITTASLKTEWEEQIAKFTDSSTLLIYGSRAKRLATYSLNKDYYIMNYEQAINDFNEINRMLCPDIIILDEAQRIKNWQTKTASKIKMLESRYAFVLTGTPIENRIDDIYSIVQFLDPYLLGPLFRFNREFYQFDDEGKVNGYKNLNTLYQRLREVMLCRRKSDVEGELPNKVVDNYFVAMDKEQQIRYDEYHYQVALLLARAKKRPLKKEELDKLQRLLACMRMLCDTPYILDSECKLSPKITELTNILDEVMSEKDNKVIIFSEWARMLELVREMAEENSWGYAWHTGSVNQKKRRDEINNFKNNDECRLFLSTDSGSVGLNLQVANIVINLDLPWNPAKLEQRIARSWRKHQKRQVQVINLVCENSIEHRMLGLLEQKKLMAHSVLTGDEEFDQMDLPSGRQAFIDRMNDLMGENGEKGEKDSETISQDSFKNSPSISDDNSEANIDTSDNIEDIQPIVINRVKTDLINDLGVNLASINVFNNTNNSNHVTDTNTSSAINVEINKSKPNNPVLLTVVDTPNANFSQTITQDGVSLNIEQIDSDTMVVINRLVKAGILSFNQTLNLIYEKNTNDADDVLLKRRLKLANGHLEKLDYYVKMAKLLLSGDFLAELANPLTSAVLHIINAWGYLSNAFETDYKDLKDLKLNDLGNEELINLIEEFKELFYSNGDSSNLVINSDTVDSLFANIESVKGEIKAMYATFG